MRAPADHDGRLKTLSLDLPTHGIVHPAMTLMEISTARRVKRRGH